MTKRNTNPEIIRVTQGDRTWECPAQLFAWDTDRNALIYRHNNEPVGSTPIDEAIEIAVAAQSTTQGETIDALKERAYDEGRYEFLPPPVSHGNWTKQDWIRYIDLNDGWTVPSWEEYANEVRS